jgi:hypothetical protein
VDNTTFDRQLENEPQGHARRVRSEFRWIRARGHREIFTEDCAFYEPKGVYHDRDEIDRVAGDPDKHSSWFFRLGRPK